LAQLLTNLLCCDGKVPSHYAHPCGRVYKSSYTFVWFFVRRHLVVSGEKTPPNIIIVQLNFSTENRLLFYRRRCRLSCPMPKTQTQTATASAQKTGMQKIKTYRMRGTVCHCCTHTPKARVFYLAVRFLIAISTDSRLHDLLRTLSTHRKAVGGSGIWVVRVPSGWACISKASTTITIMAAPPVGVFVVFPVAVAVRTIVQM